MPALDAALQQHDLLDAGIENALRLTCKLCTTLVVKTLNWTSARISGIRWGCLRSAAGQRPSSACDGVRAPLAGQQAVARI